MLGPVQMSDVISATVLVTHTVNLRSPHIAYASYIYYFFLSHYPSLLEERSVLTQTSMLIPRTASSNVHTSLM